MTIDCEVLIIGAGTTGLYLANLLQDNGIHVVVAEKRTSKSLGTRAIGLHPPALQYLEELGLMETAIARGVEMRQGHVYIGKKFRGTLQLVEDTDPYAILSLPQPITENLLESRLHPTTILTGYDLEKIERSERFVRSFFADVNGDTTEIRSKLVIGADGFRSKTRTIVNGKYTGSTIDVNFTMLDLEDQTDFGDSAVIMLSNSGLVESFPLPGNLRRWIVNHQFSTPSHSQLEGIISERGHLVPKISDEKPLSHFMIHEFMTDKLFYDRVFIIGDAACVMSPIGGQAISVHWHICKRLVSIIGWMIHNESTESNDLTVDFERFALSTYRKYTRRASMNTSIGFPGRPEWFLSMLSKALLLPGIRKKVAQRFSMQDLKH